MLAVDDDENPLPTSSATSDHLAKADMASSYTLERTRTRPPPPPLRLHKSPVRNSSSLADSQLLYDLPSSSSIGSPPPNQSFLTSPTSATSPGGRQLRQGRPGRRRRPSSPSRSRSVTPQFHRRDEFEIFAQNCRAWYFEQNEESGNEMTKTLTRSPPGDRAQYARIQAVVRAAYHAHAVARRRSEFQAHINATAPGGSLMPHCRANPNGPIAREERKEHLDRFLKAWCNVGMPGTKPFFEGLWAVMRLQLVPEKLGGTGRRRVLWEFDDAVFMESAGKEFMLEAIDVLKGLLGFQDKSSPRPVSSQHPDNFTIEAQAHSRSQSEPLSSLFSDSVTPTPRKPQRPAHGGRSRAPSDPFLDINTPSTLVGSGSNGSSLRGASGSISPSATHDSRTGLSFGFGEDLKSIVEQATTGQKLSEADDSEQLRTWLSPDLSNPELTSLLASFPSFLTQRTLPRFPIASNAKTLDLEEGEYDDSDEVRNEIRVGTGVMWLSTEVRGERWRGSLWERVRYWWRKLFC